jgi:hypothetical protein
MLYKLYYTFSIFITLNFLVNFFNFYKLILLIDFNFKKICLYILNGKFFSPLFIKKVIFYNKFFNLIIISFSIAIIFLLLFLIIFFQLIF